jgi:hypothetical protein
MMVTSGPNGPIYSAPLDKGSPPRYQKGKVPFDSWWNKIVLSDTEKHTFSRKDLVLSVSNKDGGAHIDKTLDEQYARLKRFKTLGLQFVSHGQPEIPATGPELVSIRQICYEVITTLMDEFPHLFQEK